MLEISDYKNWRLYQPSREKTGFYICKNKDADQLRGNREADQRLCFAIRIVLSLYYLHPKFQASSVAVQTGLCQTWSETPKTGFLTTRLILSRQQKTKALNSLGSSTAYQCSCPSLIQTVDFPKRKLIL